MKPPKFEKLTRSGKAYIIDVVDEENQKLFGRVAFVMGYYSLPVRWSFTGKTELVGTIPLVYAFPERRSFDLEFVVEKRYRVLTLAEICQKWPDATISSSGNLTFSDSRIIYKGNLPLLGKEIKTKHFDDGNISYDGWSSDLVVKMSPCECQESE